MKGIIYEVTSPIGKKYYGQTTQSLEKRKLRHLRDAKNNCPFRLHQALRKHGMANFRWCIKESFNVDKNYLTDILNERESFWIQKNNTRSFDQGYNMTHGGDNFMNKKKWNHTEESKEKIRQSLLGKKHTKERRRNQSLAQQGKDQSANFGPPRHGKDNGMYIPITPGQERRIVELHTEGLMSARSIAKTVGINDGKVLKLLRDEGRYIPYGELKEKRKV